MQEDIHGHEVMKMMIQSGETYTRATLKLAIHQQFGESARFFTCSASGMDADGLIDFLAMRGKFTEEPSGLSMSEDKMCKH